MRLKRLPARRSLSTRFVKFVRFMKIRGSTAHRTMPAPLCVAHRSIFRVLRAFRGYSVPEWTDRIQIAVSWFFEPPRMARRTRKRVRAIDVTSTQDRFAVKSRENRNPVKPLRSLSAEGILLLRSEISRPLPTVVGTALRNRRGFRVIRVPRSPHLSHDTAFR